MNRFPLLVFAIAAGTAIPAQQQCASRNDDGTLVTNVTTGGPNLSIGMKLTAQASYTIAAVQVHTGLQDGAASMAIWSHDAAGDKPNQNISGDGPYQQCALISWQGAVLPTPVSVSLGQEFWVVWSMPNSSRTPWSTNPVGDVPYRGSFDGGQTWNGANNGQNPWPAKPYKIRLFCPYTTSPHQAIGQGKAGDGGFVPRTVMSGWSAPGNELYVSLKDGAPGVAAVLGIGTPTNFVIPGLATVYVLPLVTVTALTSGTPPRSPPGSGRAGALALRIPRLGAVGALLSLQWFLLDAQAVGGLSHTDGTQILVL